LQLICLNFFSMKRYFFNSLFIFSILLVSFTGSHGKTLVSGASSGSQDEKPVNVRMIAAEAAVNPEGAMVEEDDRLSSKKGVALKPGVTAAIDGERDEADRVVSMSKGALIDKGFDFAISYGDTRQVLLPGFVITSLCPIKNWVNTRNDRALLT
jgi:hypothetical protein